jgi:hypothetical protein
MSTEIQAGSTDAQRNGRPEGDVLTVTDSRTGKTYELPIEEARSAPPSCARSRWIPPNSG